MKVQYLNPCVKAAVSVLKAVLGESPTAGAPTVQAHTFACQQCNIICGVTGQVQGQIILGMNQKTAAAVAAQMVCQSVEYADALASSAIAELGNMICGHAMNNLLEGGFECDITPPTLIQGASVRISTLAIPAVVVPIRLMQGTLSLTLGLQSRK